MNNRHTFTRSELVEARDILVTGIKRYIGDLWNIKSDGEYAGCTWECTSPLLFDLGVWRLCQQVVHKGARRAYGKVEIVDSGSKIMFTVLFDKNSIIT